MTAELCGEDKEALTTECIQQIQIPCKCKYKYHASAYNKYKYHASANTNTTECIQQIQIPCKNTWEIRIQSNIFTFAHAIWMYRYCRKYKKKKTCKHIFKTITSVYAMNLPKKKSTIRRKQQCQHQHCILYMVGLPGPAVIRQTYTATYVFFFE